jgi:hypothetical protein
MNDLIVPNERKLKHKMTYNYVGKAVSLNHFYEQKHWKFRNDLKNKYKTIFRAGIRTVRKKIKEPLSKYVLFLYYNSKHDPDNTVGMEKIFVDSIKAEEGFKGLVIDDDKRYSRGVALLPDEELKFNTFKFVLYEVKENDNTTGTTK